MAHLEYFKCYAARYETDEKVKVLGLSEEGLYFRCLRHAWLNDGLPNDLGLLAEMVHATRKEIDRYWPRVSKCFVLSENGRLVNPRQEEEREKALLKSNKAARSAGMRWQCERNANASTDECERIHSRIATRVLCVSSKSSSSESDDGSRFREFWQRYPNKVGEQMAVQMWLSVVDDADAVFAGLERWEKSSQWSRGIIERPETWLSKRMWLDQPIQAEASQKPVNYAPCAQCGASMVAVGGKCPECGTERTES